MENLENEWIKTLINQESLKSLSRYALYTVIFLGVALLLPFVIPKGNIRSIDENGFIENSQLVVLGLSALIFVIGFWLMEERRGAFAILITFISMAIIRENDENLSIVPVLGWHGPMAIFVICGAFLIYRYRANLKENIDWVMSAGYAFPLMWCGFITAVAFAQPIGRFLTVLLGNDYTYNYKQLVEECSELLGYLFIFIGSVELVWSGKSIASSEKRN